MNFDYVKNNDFAPYFVGRLADEQFRLEFISVIDDRCIEISPVPGEVVGSNKIIHMLISDDIDFSSCIAIKNLASIPAGSNAQSVEFQNFISDFSLAAIDYSDKTKIYEQLSPSEITNYLIGGAYFSQYTHTGQDNGTIVDYDSTEAEPDVWTVTLLSPTIFSVNGEVRGSFGGGTVGEAYDNSFISFTLNQGTTPFIPGDTFVFKINHRVISKTAELKVDLNIEIGNKKLKIQGCENFKVIYFISGFSSFDQAQSILSPKQQLDNLKNMVMHKISCTYSDLTIT